MVGKLRKFVFIIIYLFLTLYIYYSKAYNVDTPREGSVCGVFHWHQISSSDAM
jgi:hypothetical protein